MTGVQTCALPICIFDPTYYSPHFSTNTANSLTGTWESTQWVSALANVNEQRVHIDLGEAQLITNIYYENAHSSGNNSDAGAKNFTLWGSNNAAAFAELTYGTDTNWTRLQTSLTQFAQHAAADAADPQRITVLNTTGATYRYYAFKIADNWGHANFVGIRRLVLQTGTAGAYRLTAAATSTGASAVQYRLKQGEGAWGTWQAYPTLSWSFPISTAYTIEARGWNVAGYGTAASITGELITPP